jgi:hypothetical protein
MGKKGVGTIELIVLIASMISAVGGAWLGYDYGAPEKQVDEKALVINVRGEASVMELETGKTYDAMITPDGRIIVKEKP